ncbi:MAG: glutamate cyclase domain-containing protein [Halioglobus sp.]
MTDQEISEIIEDLMVARNLRNMQHAQAALTPGYYLRAARHLNLARGNIIIGTGFPVADTFETDGPVGALALYEALELLGNTCWLACASPLAAALADDYRILPLAASDASAAAIEAQNLLTELSPEAIISIERPGVTSDGLYYNMRGEDISPRCGIFDTYLELATCPTIAIGDGGNEIGMGNIAHAIANLDINASVTTCDELLVADVSNWAAYGLIAFLSRWHQQDLLAQHNPLTILQYLSDKGSVDGVTRANTLTEDGLPASDGIDLISELRSLLGFVEMESAALIDGQQI